MGLYGPIDIIYVVKFQGLSCLLGQHLTCISCTTPISTKSLERTFRGIAEDGSWCCFSNFHNYAPHLISLMHYYMNKIFQSIKSAKVRKNVLFIRGCEVRIDLLGETK